jgi:hypothetical protein
VIARARAVWHVLLPGNNLRSILLSLPAQVSLANRICGRSVFIVTAQPPWAGGVGTFASDGVDLLNS